MTGPLRVLMVEDSTTDAKLVVMELRRMGRPVEYERVETAEEMRAALQRQTWDVVISDWSMPKFAAPAALAIVQEKRLDLPFIIVSGMIGEDAAVEAMRAGAHDYVLKDKLSRLTPAVERGLAESKERRARRQAEDALRASEARFRRLSESGIIGIAVVDLRGDLILDANDAFAKMIGYPVDDLLRGAIRWADLTPPEFGLLAAQAVEQLHGSGVAPPWESESFRRDGSRVPMLIGMAMLDFPQCIAFTADLTERRRDETTKEWLMAEVERQQIGRERAEKALRRSEEELRQVQTIEAVDRLAGGVAIDFNKMLSVLLNYGELIVGDLKTTDPLRTDIAEVRNAVATAARLLRRLLISADDKWSNRR